MATGKALDGKPYAGNPHVRFDEGEVAPAATPRRGSLLYRTRIGTILIAVVALVVGVAAGWFAAHDGRERSPSVPDARASVHPSSDIASQCSRRSGDMRAPEQSTRTSGVRAHRPAANVVDNPRHAAAKVDADERREADTSKTDEKTAQESQTEMQKDDNPFPRYLDMFKNNPEALTAEFQKEAEADRTRQAKIREDAVAKLNLNAGQAAVFEKALDDLVAAVTQLEQEQVDLVLSGRLNMDTASDGSLWSSNPLWAKRIIAAREGAVQETAERLYEQLEFSGISDADAQNIIYHAAYNTSFSYESLEPSLQIYDKVYKNMGVGNGIFSFFHRAGVSE